MLRNLLFLHHRTLFPSLQLLAGTVSDTVGKCTAGWWTKNNSLAAMVMFPRIANRTFLHRNPSHHREGSSH
uniref:Putative secreted protein n=1 Tax=Anopheles darlingi TaxID=43151 RepID=A0A2M4D5Z3_ANODA